MAAKNVLSGAHWTGKFAEFAASIVAPRWLQDRLVILDDIERASRLSTRELLGFINEFSEQNKTRFLLILNLDQLQDIEEWDLFREKVIDAELRLEPAIDDAFEIAANDEPALRQIDVSELVHQLKVRNIRVLRKIGRLVRTVLAPLGDDLAPPVRRRVIPTLVLFPAVFYGAVPNSPPVQSLANYSALRLEVLKSSGADALKNDPVIQRVNELMSLAGIVEPDEFEAEIVRALTSGIPNSNAIDSLVGRYKREQRMLERREAIDELRFRLYWDAILTDDEVLSMIEELCENLSGLDAARVTSLANMAKDLGAPLLSERIVDNWLRETRKEPPSFAEHHTLQADRSLHPKIQNEFAQLRSAQFPALSATQAALNMSRGRGWGDREAAALKAATTEEFRAGILSVSPLERSRLSMKSCPGER